MKLIKTLIATTFALTAATTFAASAHDKSHSTKTTEEKVVVSNQEQPETLNPATTDTTASDVATSAAPTASK